MRSPARRWILNRSARSIAMLSAGTLLLAAAGGCKGVKPRDFRGEPDSGVIIVDGAAPDATVVMSCLQRTLTCPPDMYCSPDDRCIPRSHSCARTGECAPNDVCLSGNCKPPPRFCDPNADAGTRVCALAERCIAASRCAPTRTDDARRLPRCTDPGGCGPGGVCQDATCVACRGDGDCLRSLTCRSGACVERSPCGMANDCFAGNMCIGSSCRRTTAGCAGHLDNHTATTAAVLTDSYFFGRSCGSAPDYYTLTSSQSFSVPAGYGARIVVTSTRALSTVTATAAAKGKDQAAFVGLDSFLALPGITVIDAPAYHKEQTIRLKIAGNDAAGTYAIDVRYIQALCAGDAFSLYGNSDPTSAPVIDPVGSLSLRACTNAIETQPHVFAAAGAQYYLRTDVQPGDLLTVGAAFGDGSDLDLELYDAGGNLLAGGYSTSTSTESVTSPLFTTAQRIAIRVITKQAPTRGEPFTLSLRSRGARNRACATPETLDTRGGHAAVTGDLTARTDLGGATCPAYAEPGRHDALYRVVPPSRRSVIQAAVRQTNRPSTSTVTIALIRTCEDASSWIDCDDSPRPLYAAAITQELTSTAAVYLVISSDGPREDVAYALDVSIAPVGPPPNNACLQATDLPATMTVDASTFGADPKVQVETACPGAEAGDGAGQDRFFRIHLGAGERAVLEQIGPPRAPWPGNAQSGFLWAAPTCAQFTTTCTQAATIVSLPALPARLTLGSRIAADYVIAVDGLRATTRGPYRLRAIRRPDLECMSDADCGAQKCDDYRCRMPPANDACPGEQIVLASGRAVVQGSNGAAKDDYTLTCGMVSGQPDVVYRFDLGGGYSQLSARIIEAYWDPVLEIRFGGCDSPFYTAACNDDLRYPDNVLPDATVRNPAAGTYYVIVKSYRGKGPFTLEVEAVR